MTVHYDPTTARPDFYRTAIAELGYSAKAPSAEQSTKAAPQRLSRLRVPPEAPKFFVESIERARESQRPIVIDFWAPWCAPCLQLKRDTLSHSDVVKALGAVEVIYVDIDQYPRLGDAYGVVAIPDLFFIDKSGRIVDRLQNFEPPEAFVARVEQAFATPPNREGGNQ